MFRKFFLLFFIISFHNGFSQDVNAIKSIAKFSSDEELISYINKAKSNGLSLNEVENIINAQGATPSELLKLRDLWNEKSVNSSTSDNILPDSPGSFIGSTENNEITPKKTKRFGANFFYNKNINEVPQLFVATPSDYRLGPGDELIINLYGASENSYSVQISRDGTVMFDRLAPIYLSGLSIRSASARLKNRLSKLYAGLSSSDQLSKVDIDVSLKKARSVVINITGQVTAPGTYTISGFSSILNALYAAGGPNEVGTFRSIKLLRNGKIYKEIDLYDYFVNGIYPVVYVRDQDVILVDSYKKQVEVETGLKNDGLFELKENETIEDVLNYAGGFSSNSYKDKLFVNRINSYSRSIVEFSKNEFSNSILYDGDIISAKPVSDLVTNSVVVEGSVYIPGTYDLSKASTVEKLINSAKGIMPDASTSSILYRTGLGFENEIISINLNDKNNLNVKLYDQDSLVVFSLKDFDFKNKIFVYGEVNNPNEFDFYNGMTVRDAIQLSNGFTDLANESSITVIRNISTENSKYLTKEFIVDFSKISDTKSNIELMADDIITVSKIPYLKPTSSYSVSGEVAVNNSYSISTSDYSINNAFSDNIELTVNSADDGIYVLRDSIKIPISGKRISETIFEPDSKLKLVSSDIIVVPEINNTVSISGNVQLESIVPFEKGITFKSVLSSAGGVDENADLKRAYVVYQNGLKMNIKSFLGFRRYPKIKPGSEVFVPSKNQNKTKTSVGEIVGYTTSLVSIIALIKSL